MGAAAKKKDDEQLEAVDLPTDRELKLAKNFEDPALEELIPGLGSPEEGGEAALSVTEEAALAVRELVQGALPSAGLPIPGDAESIDLSADFSPDGLDLPLPEAETPVVASPPAPSLAAPARPAPGLPRTVNPNPDVLERSLLITAPSSDEHTAGSGIVNVEPSAEATREIDALHRVSVALFDLVACERAFDDVVTAGLRSIMESVDAFTGSVLELDREHEDFFFRASCGGTSSHTKLKAFRVPINKGIVGHVAESGQPLLIRNLADDEKQMRAISVSVGFEAVTCMAAPILVAGQPYGVIEVFNKRGGGFFGESDLRVLEESVRLFSKVLEVRFLMAELARRAR